MTHPFQKRKKLQPAMFKRREEIELFVEERKDEYLEFLTEKRWEDTTGRRKNFCYNHADFPEFEFHFYDTQKDLVDSLDEKGVFND
jgi:hypothetical protein